MPWAKPETAPAGAIVDSGGGEKTECRCLADRPFARSQESRAFTNPSSLPECWPSPAMFFSDVVMSPALAGGAALSEANWTGDSPSGIFCGASEEEQ